VAEFAPVETVADFKTLDDGEILEGYLDGFSGEPRPNSGHSRSYWHGWRNGMIESGRKLPDLAYQQLANDFTRGAFVRH
jgi:hypothetical protein